MKNPNRETLSQLEDIPNVGKAIGGDFRLIGIDHPDKLIGKDPFDLYEILCEKTGIRHDPCVIDVFMSAVDFMEGGEPKPWWSFTKERKSKLLTIKVKN
jgi:hypothetical protein